MRSPPFPDRVKRRMLAFGSGMAVAAPAQADADVEILEPDAHIATIAEGTKVKLAGVVGTASGRFLQIW